MGLDLAWVGLKCALPSAELNLEERSILAYRVWRGVSAIERAIGYYLEEGEERKY